MMSINRQTQTRIRCIAEEEGEVDGDGVGVPSGKISMTLREVLADVTLDSSWDELTRCERVTHRTRFSQRSKVVQLPN